LNTESDLRDSTNCHSIDLEGALLGVEALHLGPQDSDDVPEQVLIGNEAPGEEGQRVLKERVVVLAIEDGWLDIANEVLEE